MTTIDEFEALVLAQKPAEESWEPVTDYSYDVRKLVEGDHASLILETFKPTRVLDYGCWKGHLLRMMDELKPEWPHTFIGYEPDGPRRYGIYQEIPDGIEQFDLVICREVVEHCTLVDMRAVISHLCALSRQFVYLTTRFSSEHNILHVETRDDLDPTHISLPSKDLLRLLFVLEGFKRRADLEERMDWQKKNRVLVYERAA